MLKPDSLSDTLTKVEAETLRAGEIVEKLRDFLSKGDTQLVPLDVADVTYTVVTALADEARSRGVEVSVGAESVGIIAADRLQIEQVLLNLIRNAIEAAAENTSKGKQVWVRLHRSGGEVQVDVEDTGLGVQPDVAEILFEPFATRKPKGMGLGLLLSRQIVELHGGDLWCDGSVATGARFTFRLPAHESNANAD